MSDRPLDDLVSTVSEQAVVVAREQMEMARRGMASKVRQAGPGAAMLGGAGVLAVLATGTGTAGLVLLLARRPGPSAAALGVAGAYAGAGALMAREGLARVREAGPLEPEKTVEPAKQAGSAKRGTKAVRTSRRATSQAGQSATAKQRRSTSSKPRASATSKRAPRSPARRTSD